MYVAVSSGTTVTNLALYPQLEVGSEATAYEPYQGETITSDEVELYGDAHTVGKNLIPTIDEPLSANGITCTVNVDGSITLNGTATEQTIITISDFCLAKGDYVLSSGAALPTTVTIYACKKSTPTSWLGFVNTAAPVKAISLASQEFVEYRIMITRGTVSNLTVYPQLEAGSEATAYEPYQGMTTALEDGDSLDLVTGEVVRRWKRLELDGTESWSQIDSSEYTYMLTLPDKAPGYQTSVCSHFVNHNPNTGKYGHYTDDANTPNVYFNSDIATVAKWKAWLAAWKGNGAPVTVLYKLKEPEVVSGEAHSLAQPEGEMVISALGNRGETVEAVDTEARYTYRPDWDDVLNRLAALENLISEGDVTSAELAAHNTNESAHANLVIDGNIK